MRQVLEWKKEMAFGLDVFMADTPFGPFQLCEVYSEIRVLKSPIPNLKLPSVSMPDARDYCEAAFAHAVKSITGAIATVSVPDWLKILRDLLLGMADDMCSRERVIEEFRKIESCYAEGR